MGKKRSLSKCLRFLNNRSDNTYLAYEQSIGKYEKYHGTRMEELVKEALDEQTERVPNHLLKIIDRIEDFQNFLISQDYEYRTVLIHVSRIKTVYRKNRVYLPYLEEIDPKSCKHRDIIEYKDILTKDELRKVLPSMRLPMRARAMTMLQGGLSNEECEHLTTRAFIDETFKYHHQRSDRKALEWLADETNPIIWATRLVRVKTGKPYYAIIGAEAVNCIASAKLYEYELKGEIPPKLLNTHKNTMNRLCSQLNKKFGLGKAGGMYRLRPHMLRKFHATYIRGGVLSYEENTIISNFEIDELQGRGKTSVQDTYIKTNPIEQKLIYAKVMNNLTLWNEYDYEVIDGDVKIWIIDPSAENRKLKEEVKHLNKKLQKKQQASEKVKALREELGEEVFEELLGEIIGAR